MSDLIISISGVRGIAGENLTAEVAYRFGKAFGKYLSANSKEQIVNREVVIGRDTRHYGPELLAGINKGLQEEGYSVLNIGIVPTPTVQIFTVIKKAGGGIIITASHNPQQWNGLKFVSSKGMFLTENEAGEFIELYKQVSGVRDHVSVPTATPVTENPILHQEAVDYHLNKIVSNINVDLIREKKFKVAIDCANGAGCGITNRMLDMLGCDIVAINSEPKGDFNRSPEPTPANIQELCDAVSGNGADIGFAQDADADRLAIVDELGQPIGEDNTLVLAVDHVLGAQNNGNREYPVAVTNLSTTMAFDDVAGRHNAIIIRTKIGEINVSEVIKNENAVIGGEGNGGVIWPVIGLGRDSLAGIALILEYMALSDQKLSSLVNAVPKYYTVKDKMACGSKDQVQGLIDKFSAITWDNPVLMKNEMDGVKITFNDSWVHLRGSNTEPIVRIIAEAKTLKDAEALVAKVKSSIV
ncbi:MAG: phosphoglucosamine mutase [Candidatus Margulisiibacteriota bacterium]